VQRRVPSQDGEQERAGPASNIEEPAMPRKVLKSHRRELIDPPITQHQGRGRRPADGAV
jgi:hypothetical protein